MATDDEVEEARKRVDSLREDIANGERGRVDRERELANDITLAQLNAEAARLELQLAEQERLSSDEAVERGAQSPLAAAQADLERAELQKAVASGEATPAPETATTDEKATDVASGAGVPASPATPVAAVAPVAPVTPAPTTNKRGK